MTYFKQLPVRRVNRKRSIEHNGMETQACRYNCTEEGTHRNCDLHMERYSPTTYHDKPALIDWRLEAKKAEEEIVQLSKELQKANDRLVEHKQKNAALNEVNQQLEAKIRKLSGVLSILHGN